MTTPLSTNAVPSASVSGFPRTVSYMDTQQAASSPEPSTPSPKAKKKKLTKAERRQRKLLAQIEFKKLQIRDHLRRELELSRKSAKRGKTQWEDLCKEIKMIELKDEVTEWNVKTQRVMHQKDEKIMRLLDDMKTTQEMHKRNFEKHLQVLDYIISSYRTLVDAAKSLYESEAQQMIEDFYDELNEKQEIENRFRYNCENIMHATNMVVEQQMLTDYEIYLEKQDDRVNTEIEKRYIIRDSVLSKMRQLRRQLLDFVQSLQNATLDAKKYERIHWLMDKQRLFVVESQKLNDVEFKLTRTYGDLQREMVHIEVETQRRLSDLRLEQAYFLQVRKGIEYNINLDQHITFEKLKSLTGEIYGIIKEFQKFVKYGELLLSLAANCRKLQTESEKVMAYNAYMDPDNPHNLLDIEADAEKATEEFKVEALDLKSHVDLTEQELTEQMKVLKNFWRRQALVESQNLLLMEEKRKLIAENKKYIDFIKLMSKTENIKEMEAALTVTCLMPQEQECP